MKLFKFLRNVPTLHLISVRMYLRTFRLSRRGAVLPGWFTVLKTRGIRLADSEAWAKSSPLASSKSRYFVRVKTACLVCCWKVIRMIRSASSLVTLRGRASRVGREASTRGSSSRDHGSRTTNAATHASYGMDQNILHHDCCAKTRNVPGEIFLFDGFLSFYKWI